MSNSIRVDVHPTDGNRTIYLPPNSLSKIGVGVGSYVSIEGKDYAQVRSLDDGEAKVKLTNDIINDLDISLGDIVEVSAIPEANHVTFEYSTPSDIDKNIEPLIRSEIENTPVIEDVKFIERVSVGDINESVTLQASDIEQDESIVMISGNTELSFRENKTVSSGYISSDSNAGSDITYDDIGGLDDEIEKVREMIELPFKRPEVFDQVELDRPTGVLMHGPPGTGKSMLGEAVSNEVDVEYIYIEAPEVISKHVGSSSDKVKKVFDEAKENSPAIIFIDEIDAIAKKRGSRSNQTGGRVVAQLLNSMDGMDASDDVIVIGATNRKDDLDPALRRGGRFDREIEIGVPEDKERREIIDIYAERIPLSDDVDLDEINQKMNGFVGADIEAVFRESAMSAIRRQDLEYDRSTNSVDIEVTQSDFNEALTEIEPSGLREFQVETPDAGWDDIGGLEDVKQDIRESVEWSMKYKDRFDAYDLDGDDGILMYGPPGTGKTLIAKAVANETDSNFISVRGPELISKYVGESSGEIRKIFERARQNAPTVLFFDEIDAMAQDRENSASSNNSTERIVGQLLTQLDGLEENAGDITVIASTNKPDNLDDALTRSGRLGDEVYVGVPDEEARRQIIELYLEQKPVQDDLDLDLIVEKTEGYVGADIEQIVKKATMKAFRRDVQKTGDTESLEQITQQDILEAITEVNKSVSEEDRQKYKQYKEE